MPTIFNADDLAGLLRRAESLRPDSPRQWGKMDLAQMLAHMNVALEAPLGIVKLPDESNWFLRTIVKWIVLNQKPFSRNAPTSRNYKMVDAKEFELEKQKFIGLLKSASTNGLAGTWQPHVGFGPLTPEEWGRLLWKHADHHLRQFGG